MECAFFRLFCSELSIRSVSEAKELAQRLTGAVATRQPMKCSCQSSSPVRNSVSCLALP